MKPELNTDAHGKGIMAAHARVFANFVSLVNQGQTDIYILRLPKIHCSHRISSQSPKPTPVTGQHSFVELSGGERTLPSLGTDTGV